MNKQLRIAGYILGIFIIYLMGVFSGNITADKDPRPLGTTECTTFVEKIEEIDTSDESLQSCYTCLGLVKGVDIFEKEMYEKEWLE